MPVNPSNEEQLYLELINRFRFDPGGEAARLTGTNAPAGVQDAIAYFGVSVSAFQTQLAALGSAAPLAWNGNLADAADFHSQAMIAADQQSHQVPGEPDLSQRAIAAGYDWSALGENIFAFATNAGYGHAGFVIDWGYDAEDYNGNVLHPDWQTRGDGMQDPPGHRDSLISSSFTEIGISVIAESNPATQVGPNVVTQDLGNRFGYQAQFVGVVIADGDGDSFYDIGEGVGGVSVLLQRQGGASYTTTSWDSGGWQIAVPAGTYTITFSGGGLSAPIVKNAVIGSVNVKVDALGTLVAGSPPTEEPDTLFGTGASDTINGLGGNDSISGLGGDDVLIGGTGTDTLSGGTGDDSLYVDNSGDVVIELDGEGNDRVYTAVNYTLAAGAHVEILSPSDALGSAPLNLTGNELNNTIYGNLGNNVLSGGNGDDVLDGDDGNDMLVGGNGEDELYGDDGNDTLDGGANADLLAGEGGNDNFYVDNAGDVVIETAGQGTDRVYAKVSYTLAAGASVEVLSTFNYTDIWVTINLTGNELANTIYGSNGNNVINGGGGNDALYGYGTSGGIDVLDGGTGADTMVGKGSTQYYVDNPGDMVIASGTGNYVYTTISYTLAAGQSVQLLQVADRFATTALNLTGNEKGNTFVGNAGNNVISGGDGKDDLYGYLGDDILIGGTDADRMNGEGGNDSFVVDNVGDRVTELVGGGTDRVYAEISYTLAAGVSIEILSTGNPFGTAALQLTGNEIANTVYGNYGNNVLNGGGGPDALYGYNGADTFRFDSALGPGNVDRIGDYLVADDSIQLDDAVFTGLATGVLAASAFHIGAAAADADDRIIYNSATGALLFDADGTGSGAAVQFALLTAGLAMTSSEFLVV